MVWSDWLEMYQDFAGAVREVESVHLSLHSKFLFDGVANTRAYPQFQKWGMNYGEEWGAEGVGRWCPRPTRGGAMPHPQIFFRFLSLKWQILGANFIAVELSVLYA